MPRANPGNVANDSLKWIPEPPADPDAISEPNLLLGLVIVHARRGSHRLEGTMWATPTCPGGLAAAARDLTRSGECWSPDIVGWPKMLSAKPRRWSGRRPSSRTWPRSRDPGAAASLLPQ